MAGSKRTLPWEASSSRYGNSYTRHQVPKKKRTATSTWTGVGATGGTRARPIIIDVDEESDDEFDDIRPTPQEDVASIGHLPCKIVGIQYYRGIATLDENLLFIREPQNPYDRNAIRVDNVANIQVGHIPRDVAAVLAPLLDTGALQAEGTVVGIRNTYSIPISIQLFAPSSRSASTLEKLGSRLDIRYSSGQAVRRDVRPPPVSQQRNYVAASAPGVPASHSHGMAYDHLLAASAAFDPRSIRDAPERFGLSVKDLEALPRAKQPSQVKTKMLPYQLQGLHWLMKMEHPKLPQENNVVQFWKRIATNWLNVATHYTMTSEPTLARGGILADDMGLGKTLQIISLIVADPSKNGITPVPIPPEAKGTLIISPLSLLSNWTSQISQHLHDSTLSVLVFHGLTRSDPKIYLDDYDIVITSYGTLMSDYKAQNIENNPTKKPAKNKKSFFGRLWRRVVLDEGHTIRNPKTKYSLAATRIGAVTRWSLTGTPIINSMSDLYSQIRFLRYSGGFAEQEIFNRLIIRPLRSADPSAAGILQNLMRDVCLRRRKDMEFEGKRIVELPGVEEYLHKIEFSPQERKGYLVLEKEAKGLLERINHGEEKGYSFILELLLRMRQFSDHWSLCHERLNALIELAKAPKVELTPENITLLQQMLDIAIEAQEDCPVCMDIVDNTSARITKCKHVFCANCIETVIANQHKCPLCRTDLPSAETTLVVPVVETQEGEDDQTAAKSMDGSSSKLDALLHILEGKASVAVLTVATRSKDRSVKTVVFSQFTKFLDIIESQLKKRGWDFVRLDGTMNIHRRDSALDTFSTSPTHTIMLASLAVCSVGLNLVSASQVVLSDSWWAPSIEDQAVDRVHRLGQVKKVTVFRLVMKDSIEERVLEIQMRKRKMISDAFNEKREKHVREARLADLTVLLGRQA